MTRHYLRKAPNQLDFETASLQAINAETEYERFWGLLSLTNIGDEQSVHVISTVILNDKSDYVACAAIVLLNTIERSRIQVLRVLLLEPLVPTRIYSIFTALMVSRDCTAMPQARELLSHSDWFVRLGAVRYLVRCQRDAHEFIPIIRGLLMTVPTITPVDARRPGVFIPDPVFGDMERARRNVRQLLRKANRWRRTKWLI